MFLQNLRLTDIMPVVTTLKAIKFEDAPLVDEAVVQSFTFLLDFISVQQTEINIESVIDAVEQMVKWHGLLLCRQLTLAFCQLHSHCLKTLTRNLSPKLSKPRFMTAASHAAQSTTY